jgi:hypothetical protein
MTSSATSATERVGSSEREGRAWLALGEIGGDNFRWIHDRAYDPARVPEPEGYARVLAAYA